MKRFLIYMIALVAAGCLADQSTTSKQPQEVPDKDAQARSIAVLTNLAQVLTADFSTTKVEVAGQKLDIAIFWFPEAHVFRYQRPFDLWVPAAKTYAFVDPIQNTTIKGPSLKDIREAVRLTLESYLKARQVVDIRVFTLEMGRKSAEPKPDGDGLKPATQP